MCVQKKENIKIEQGGRGDNWWDTKDRQIKADEGQSYEYLFLSNVGRRKFETERRRSSSVCPGGRAVVHKTEVVHHLWPCQDTAPTPQKPDVNRERKQHNLKGPVDKHCCDPRAAQSNWTLVSLEQLEPEISGGAHIA